MNVAMAKLIAGNLGRNNIHSCLYDVICELQRHLVSMGLIFAFEEFLDNRKRKFDRIKVRRI
jgi:hypothetical protein